MCTGTLVHCDQKVWGVAGPGMRRRRARGLPLTAKTRRLRSGATARRKRRGLTSFLHGGQGDSLVPAYTHGSVSLSVFLCSFMW